MTLGEHIQALRKAAGLSQEALGEQLGVTRQSISKWESDLAMPEVEKLIAMSKLFGVSVGSLLQVEEARTLTAEELSAVEAVARRYLESVKHRTPKWPFVLAALALAAGIALGALTPARTEQPPPAAAETPSPARVEVEELWQEGDTLVDFSGHLGLADFRSGTVTLTFSTRPARLEPDTDVFFLVDADGKSQVVEATLQTGLTYTGKCTVPLSGEVTVSVLLSGQDQRVQPAMMWRHLDRAMDPEIAAAFTGDADWDEESQVLRVSGAVEATMKIPYGESEITYAPTGVKLTGLRFQTTDRRPGYQDIVIPLDHRVPPQMPYRQDFAIDIPIAPGERIELRLVTDWERDNASFAIESMILTVWRDEDGTFHRFGGSES